MDKRWIILPLLIAANLSSFAQESDYSEPIQDSLEIDVDIFAEDKPAEITLKYNVKEYQKNKYSDDYMTAELIYHLGDSMADRHQTVRIKARGANRRERCSFPPLWINIKKADIHNKTLQNTKKIKLVTHCGGSVSYSNYILKEYLAYKIYNIISPYSFRVRLVRIKYIDTGRKNKLTDSWAVLIEPEDILAERLNMLPIKNDKLSIHITDTLQTNYMAIFQYMIGNADYSVAGRHNVKLARSKDFDKPNLIPIPYDFDYTGIVNAHYAVPGDNLGITSVTERYFLGPCRNTDQYQTVLDDILSKKEEIYSLVNSFPYLSEQERENVRNYLDEFFNSATKKNFIENSFLSTCRE